MATTPVSPKVVVGGITSVVLIVVLAAINAVTPDLFDFAGEWKGVVYAAVVGLGAALGGYVKHDPLRDPQIGFTDPFADVNGN